MKFEVYARPVSIANRLICIPSITRMRLGGYAEACGEGDVVPVRFSTDEIDSLDDAVVRLRARPRSALIRDAVQKSLQTQAASSDRNALQCHLEGGYGRYSCIPLVSSSVSDGS